MLQIKISEKKPFTHVKHLHCEFWYTISHIYKCHAFTGHHGYHYTNNIQLTIFSSL